MFDHIVSEDNFDLAFMQTQKGSPKYKPGAIRFAANETRNIELLRQEVMAGEYEPRGYIEFSVYEPKERIIYAPMYSDKIVQHAADNVLRDFYEPKFIHDSYACIRNKGNQRAVYRIQQFERRAMINYLDPWIIKADVQKFFYSIDREVLLEIVRRKITCPHTLALLEVVIRSSPGELGLPLGCLTSQLLANVLMNELDHYIKRTLGVKHYVRYADDLVLIVDGKAQAADVLGAIGSFGRDVLHLTFPERKCFIRPCHLGVETLGYRITVSGIHLTSKAKSRFIKRLKVTDQLLLHGRLAANEATAELYSWYSYAGIAQCQRFIAQACERTHNIRFTQNERFIARAA